ncbi:MAG: amino acid adenylation domain-containing protein [Nostoc sp.]|uniref:non-ribosomal peptide synthetase n=1 Tax=Nostoc sp. TaxID=1180 RepID=UPI002FF72B60
MSSNSQTYHCIHKVFETQVLKTPDAVALIYENAQLSYYEINRRANQLAYYLQKIGVKPDVPVGIYVERSLEMVIGILGILKSGGAYVPLDPAYPLERIAFMLEDVKVPIILTQQQLVERLPGYWAQVICLDTDWETFTSENEVNPHCQVTPENLAYIIYTSGSTGRPKGIEIPHRSVIGCILDVDYLHLDSEQTFLQHSSISWDAFTLELWSMLLHGGCCALYPGKLITPENIGNAIQIYGVNVLWLTSSLFNVIIDSLPKALSGVRQLLVGGEELSSPHVRHALELLPSLQLSNGYGPSECTVFACSYYISSSLSKNVQSIPIGKPIGDRRVYLLDIYLNRVPIGIPGELYISGDALARGYLNQPGMTAEKFVPNSFGKEGSRLYKTGDLARYLADGNIEFLGRIDDQVKIRGYRIEIREIEAVLSQYLAVREVVVMAQADEVGSKRLVAYVVPNPEHTPTTNELRNFLKSRLPEYMVPSAFIVLEKLPLAPNGKVNRQALPKPDQVRPELEETFVPPHTPQERILAEIWAQVLNVKQVGIKDNFFVLGGDSIRSIQVQSLLQQQGLNFSIQQLFQYQTIHELAQNLTSVETDTTATQPVQSFSLISEKDRLRLPNGLENAYPLTMLQMGMLFHSEYNLESAVFHDVFSFHLRAPFDSQVLLTAIQQLLASHPVLRTSFNLTDFSEPLQLVHQTVNIPWQVEDLCHLSLTEQEKAMAFLIENEKKRHFDWTNPPLLRIQIHLRTRETFQFTLSFHHAILDGWSLGLTLTELLERYFCLLKEQVSLPLLPPASTFQDFVALQQKALKSEEFRQYWLQKLDGSTNTILPRWFPSNLTLISVESQTLEVPICSQVSEDLKKLAKSLAVPLKSVLLAAHLKVISLLSNQLDVLTGLSSNGRPETTDGERSLGLFLNTLPFRLKLHGGNWIDLIRQTLEVEQELLPFRWYPMAQIKEDLCRERLFETSFNFTHFHIYQRLQTLGDLEILAANGSSIKDFTLLSQFSLDIFSSQIRLSLDFNAAELCIEQVKDIGNYYTMILTVMSKEPFESYEFSENQMERREKEIEKSSLQKLKMVRRKAIPGL